MLLKDAGCPLKEGKEKTPRELFWNECERQWPDCPEHKSLQECENLCMVRVKERGECFMGVLLSTATEGRQSAALYRGAEHVCPSYEASPMYHRVLIGCYSWKRLLESLQSEQLDYWNYVPGWNKVEERALTMVILPWWRTESLCCWKPYKKKFFWMNYYCHFRPINPNSSGLSFFFSLSFLRFPSLLCYFLSCASLRIFLSLTFTPLHPVSSFFFLSPFYLPPLLILFHFFCLFTVSL